MGKDYTITIKGGGFASQQGKRGPLSSVPGNPNVDRRRGGLEPPCFVAWTNYSVMNGGQLRIDLPSRDGAPLGQNRDASFKSGDLLILKVQSYGTLTKPAGWENVPNGSFTVAGMNHQLWWKRLEQTDSVWVFTTSDIFADAYLFGIRGAISTGDPFYSSELKAYPSTSTKIDVTAQKRGDLYFALGFPSTFSSNLSSPPVLRIYPEDLLTSYYDTYQKLGNTDENLNTTEAQLQSIAAINNQATKKYGKLDIGGWPEPPATGASSGQVFSVFVKQQTPKKPVDCTVQQKTLPLKRDILLGVWFNDGDYNPNSLESYPGFWADYFTEFDFSVGSVGGTSVHVGYRIISDEDFNLDNQFTIRDFLPENAVYLRFASEKVELIGTGGGSDVISLSGTAVNSEDMVVLFTVFAEPHFFLDGGFNTSQLDSLSLTLSALDFAGATTFTKFGKTGSRIYASTAYGKGTAFSASYNQTRFGGGPVTPALTFALKVRRKK